MDWSGWALFGFAATLALTAIMSGAQMAGLSRMDIPFMLGTMVSAKPDAARVAGFFMTSSTGSSSRCSTPPPSMSSTGTRGGSAPGSAPSMGSWRSW